MIPEAAIEAGAGIIYRTSGRERVMSYDEAQHACEREAQEILEAAAPHMRGPLRDVLAMCDKADTDPGSMCGKLTTWEIRQALGANRSTPDA